MNELGNILREAREAKGLTLAEAQENTRISARFLDALENAQYELLPTTAHVRGFLRNYARFLELDPQPLLDRYELGKESHPAPAARPADNGSWLGGPLEYEDDQPFFDPVNLDLRGARRRGSGSFQRLVIIAALLVTLALIASRFVPLITGNGEGADVLTNGIDEAVSNILNGDTDEGTETPDASLVPGAGAPITSTERNESIRIPTPTATRPLLPATLESIRLRLEITERTWMRVSVDGDVVFEGLAKLGDEPYEWQAEQEAILLTGNAAGIFVTINEIRLGKLGGRGEVVEETWTTTGSQ